MGATVQHVRSPATGSSDSPVTQLQNASTVCKFALLPGINMMLTAIDDAQRKAARVAGFTLLFAMAIVMFGTYYLSADLYVPGDAAQTAKNILTHETRFRLHVAFNLLYVVNSAVLTSALYVILKPVSQGLALVAAFCRLTYALVWLVIALDMLGSLRLLGYAPYLQVFEADRLQALARVRLNGNWDAYYVGLPFWTLASTLCSYLWFKSAYIPRALAAFGVIASAWCAMCAFAFIVFPVFNQTIDPNWFDAPMALFEMATGFWLLFRGLKPSVQDASDAASGG
ncbi:MAG TPA: DUF4386 domain-containing protein [Xanthomonadaceae bacterium]